MCSDSGVIIGLEALRYAKKIWFKLGKMDDAIKFNTDQNLKKYKLAARSHCATQDTLLLLLENIVKMNSA